MTTIDHLADQLNSYMPAHQINSVKRAYFFAEQAHDGQYRRSGEAYIHHPLAVAGILAELRMDYQSLMAAMLHDVIEDTGIPKEALAAQFDDTVTELVDGVSKLTKIKFENREQAQAENFQKMALAMAADIRVILVKLADRLHNMRTLGPLSWEKRRRIATETLEIYAPIANRLGINAIRVELEDLGFNALYPMRARRIGEAVKQLRGNHREIIDDIKGRLENLLAERGLPGTVIGREKHLYSIYNKMRTQHKSFHEIMDVYAFRIITDKEDDCYRILGAVHSLYKPVPGRFKDYIAMSKSNGYRSLHTTLFGLHVNIEVQIRTAEMEAMANNGIAAHWLYKDEGEAPLNHSQVKARKWVQNLIQIQEHSDDPLEFIENVKVDLFPDEVYVFTPKGRILELPAGATPVDFAYAIHTDVGNSCVACRINKHLASLSIPLQSGQTVEIITKPGAQPNPGWMNFIVTGKAKSSIRHFLNNQKRQESIAMGRLLTNRSLGHFSQHLDRIDPAHLDQIAAEEQVENFDALLEQVGIGKRMPFALARMLLPSEQVHAEVRPEPSTEVTDSPALSIEGTEGLLVSYGICCRPIPGDEIIGLMDAGAGIVIHRESCTRVKQVRKDPDRHVQLEWAKHIDQEFAVGLRVELERQRGVIAELASTVTYGDANIEKISVEEQNARLSVISLVIHVQGRKHLARVMRRLRNIRAIIRVSRVRD